MVAELAGLNSEHVPGDFLNYAKLSKVAAPAGLNIFFEIFH
jgi:hypothetical protein